jgi:protein-S-isoprenylcysteine O-methyltransferase Ste14
VNALEHRIPPPLVVLIVCFVMWVTARYTVPWPISDAIRLVSSAIVLVSGLAFGASGFMAFGRARTTIDPVNLESASVLVTKGVFRISRNPMYVGFTLILAAWAMFLAAPWTIFGVVGFVLFIWKFQILPEERVMKAKFGQPYEEYVRRVRRWI